MCAVRAVVRNHALERLAQISYEGSEMVNGKNIGSTENSDGADAPRSTARPPWDRITDRPSPVHFTAAVTVHAIVIAADCVQLMLRPQSPARALL